MAKSAGTVTLSIASHRGPGDFYSSLVGSDGGERSYTLWVTGWVIRLRGTRQPRRAGLHPWFPLHLPLGILHAPPYPQRVANTIPKSRPAGRNADLFFAVLNSRRKLATAAAALLALGLGYHVVFGRNGLIIYEQKRMDARKLDGELRALALENERLKGHVDRLQSDPDAIEHQAREELHYTRPGEVIYTLPSQPGSKD